MAMLEVKNLSVSYGHVSALKNVSIEANEGEIYCIIGSNGAGKTSLLRTISGLVKPQTGSVEFMGEKLPTKPSRIVEKGIVHVPEGRKTFSGLAIRDNLLIGAYLYPGSIWRMSSKNSTKCSLFCVSEKISLQALSLVASSKCWLSPAA